MVRNGGVQGGGNNGGKGKNNANGLAHNHFLNLETTDRSPGEDSSSLFYFSNGDHPGLHLVSTHLVGSNYNSWNRAMTMALVAKNKLCFLDGSITQPVVEDLIHGLWSRCNNMVMSWLLHSVSKDIVGSIMYLDNGVDMWNDFYDRFHQGNNLRVFQIKQLLNNLT
ncbi:hypothetical protein UlMin_040515 [Ulmus minor]